MSFLYPGHIGLGNGSPMLYNGPHLSPWDFLSLGTFCPLGRFVPWDVLPLGTFCPLGCFVSLGHFVPGTLCPWDVMSLGTFCPLGHFVPGTFCPWDVSSLGRFVPGTFCLGMFCLGTFCMCIGSRQKLSGSSTLGESNMYCTEKNLFKQHSSYWNWHQIKIQSDTLFIGRTNFGVEVYYS